VRRLREAGAVIIGKTNLSEWANFRSSQSSSGWSGRGGQCLNPYALDRNPCGSSSGTGSAIAANLAPVGVGTETDGSVVCPSSAAALVGIKPTLGLVSRRGIVPIAHSQDTAGPMARTVRDAAILLGVLADGHVLIEDFPGLAKTLIARSFAEVTSMRFTRVQFTPDLMPGDVTGSSIFNQRTSDFEFRRGPIFTNILLADVANAPALVEAARQEGVLIHAVSATRIRAVTHLDFPPTQVDEAAARLRRAAARA